MAIYEVVRGIVLRETETREADKILTVLTAEKGKIPVIARGARRRGSKIAAASQLLAYSELTVYQSRDWYMLTEASTLALFPGLRQELERLALASYFAELTETVTEENVPAPETLPLLLNALYALGEQKKPPEAVKAAFELRLLALAGYAPLLEGCARCGSETPEAPQLDVAEGVLLCGACRSREDRGCRPLDEASLSAARYILNGEAKRLYAFRLEEGSLRLLSAACEAFAAAQLERRFRTLDFYRSLQP